MPLKDVRIPDTGSPKRLSRLYLDPDTAALVRRIADRESMLLSEFVDACLRAYIQLKHPDWELIEEGTPEAARYPPPHRREEEPGRNAPRLVGRHPNRTDHLALPDGGVLGEGAESTMTRTKKPRRQRLR